MKKKHIRQICILITITMLLAAPSYAAYESSIVGHWDFEEGTGTTANDSSTYGNTGVLNNMTNDDWVSGKVDDYALDFDGSGDYVQCGSDSSLDISGDLTITTWVYPRSDALSALVDMAQEGTTHENYGLLMCNYITFQYSTPTFYEQFYIDDFYTVNDWQHVAVTWDSGTITMYKDGSYYDHMTTSYSLPANTSNVLRLGRYQVGSQGWFNGILDDTAIWNRALDTNEIAALNYDHIGVEEFESILVGANTTFSLGYTTDQIKQLCQLYSEGKSGLDPSPIEINDIWWTYRDHLRDEENHSMGEAYIYDGNYYIKLGSGIGQVPEPLTVLSFITGIFMSGLSKVLKRKFEK